MAELLIPDALLASLADQIAGAVVERLPDRPGPYMTADDAAEYLACGRKRIYELIEQGRVRHYRDGRRILFRPSDLDDALREVLPR